MRDKLGRDAIAKGGVVQLVGVGIYTILLVRGRSKHIRQVLLMPRRNALRKSTKDIATRVAEWDKLACGFSIGVYYPFEYRQMH